MKQRYAIVGLALLLVGLLVTACSMALQLPGSGSNSRSTWNFVDRTTVNTLTYQVQEKMRTANLSLRIDVDKGSVTWTLTDPHGKVAWEGTTVAGRKVDEDRRFEPIAGEGKLAIALADASGRYEANWVAR